MTMIDHNDYWLLKEADWLTWMRSKVQLVLSLLVPNSKPAILNMDSFISSSQIYSKPVLFFISCQTVYLVQSEPKFTNQVTEATFVVGPGAVKINRAIQSLLEHCPPTTGCCLVTEHIKGTWTIRVDCINTADSLTGFVQLSTVLNCWRKM